MAYNETTAERVRAILSEHEGIAEIRMFGGLCFTLRGNMCCGVHNDALMLRLGDERAARALERDHVRPMEFTGTTMRSMAIVDPDGYRTDRALREWVEQAVAHAAALPEKAPKARKTARPARPTLR